eukprot:UN29939
MGLLYSLCKRETKDPIEFENICENEAKRLGFSNNKRVFENPMNKKHDSSMDPRSNKQKIYTYSKPITEKQLKNIKEKLQFFPTRVISLNIRFQVHFAQMANIEMNRGPETRIKKSMLGDELLSYNILLPYCLGIVEGEIKNNYLLALGRFLKSSLG